MPGWGTLIAFIWDFLCRTSKNMYISDIFGDTSRVAHRQGGGQRQGTCLPLQFINVDIIDTLKFSLVASALVLRILKMTKELQKVSFALSARQNKVIFQCPLVDPLWKSSCWQPWTQPLTGLSPWRRHWSNACF